MNTVTRDKVVKASMILAVLALSAGCAATAPNIDSTNELARASSGTSHPVVFGKLEFVRNGERVELGEGLMATTAKVQLFDEEGNRQIVGGVGHDGEFSWVLEPGTYQVARIGFRYQGQNVEPETSFQFTVSPDHDATYIGTISLEATMDSGYMGVNGTVDKFTVWNECASDCESRLTELGLSDNNSTMSLFRWDGPQQ